ncbi:MAG TPA: hypothetical protein VMW56_08065 [Candidatus Margulisiibacteriota bacterium]|nr:hypothetical protein [Candidatus Margulisiibacteriota bacterium]
MTPQLDHLCTSIRSVLSQVQARAQSASVRSASNAETLELALRAEIADLDDRIAANRVALKAAHAQVTEWICAEHADSEPEASPFVAPRSDRALTDRAKAADRYADAMALIATAAVERAAKAALEAAAIHCHCFQSRHIAAGK